MLLVAIVGILALAIGAVALVVFGIPCFIGYLVDTMSEGSKGSRVALITEIGIIIAVIVILANVI